jgi:hypothetical protein
LSRQHYVFYDQLIAVGEDWDERLKAELNQADYLLVFISEASIGSESVAREIASASSLTQRQGGRPAILPVRLAYSGSLPESWVKDLDKIQYFYWNDAADTPSLIEEILRAISQRESASIQATSASNPELPANIGQIDADSIPPEQVIKKADEVFDSLTTVEKEVARRMLTRLVRVGEPNTDVHDTQRGVRVSELLPDTELLLNKVIETLSEAGLVRTGRDIASGERILNLVDDTLINEWQPLKIWIRADRKFLWKRQALRTNMANWASTKDQRFLLQGRELREAQWWQETRWEDLNPAEMSFVAESRRARRTRQRLKLLYAAIILGLLISAILVYFYIIQP